MGIRALYSARIGVREPQWTDLPAEPPTAAGRDVPDAGPRAARTLRAARDPSFLEPRPHALPQGSSWCANLSDLASRIKQAEAWRSHVDSMPDSPLKAVEAELAGKLTLQRGAASGWDVFHDGLGLPGGAPLDEALAAIADYLVDRFPPIPPFPTPVPRGTNSGAPTYGTSDIDKLLHALLARQLTDWESAEKVYQSVSGMFEAIPSVHALTFSRTGPVGKPVPMYDWQGPKFMRVAEATSLVPRRRAVFGVPAFINMALLPSANVVKHGVMRTPWTAHTSERAILEDLVFDVATVGPGAQVLSDDISGFDQSVRRRHQVGVAEALYAKYWDQATVNLWLGAQQMPVLGPPLTAGMGGWLYERPHGGVTTSGIITTTLDGTLINMARAVTAVGAALGLSPTASFEALVRKRWSAKFWGDDTILVVPPAFDMDKYVAANADIGYKTSLLPGATFLMKHYDISRRAVYPLATRVFQQTIWNEHGGRTPEIELLGLYARTTGFEANPLARTMWSIVTTDAPTLEKWGGLQNRRQLVGVLADPGFRATLETGIRENRALVRGWLARAERGSAEDEGLIAWLTSLVGGGAITDEGELTLNPAIATLKDARSKALQLAGYLATPVEQRTNPPGWVDDLINPSVDEAAEEGMADTK